MVAGPAVILFTVPINVLLGAEIIPEVVVVTPVGSDPFTTQE
jgi:hypothetical protein